MKTVYLHIGYPKAASTFLQKSVFNNQKEIHFLNQFNWRELSEFSNFLFWSKDDEFENNINSYLNIFDKVNSHKINVISHEGYSNFSSNSEFRIDKIFLRLKKVSEIKKINFKFIFVIRKQSEYIKSRYAQGHGLTGFYSVNKNFIKFSQLKGFFYRDEKTEQEIKAFDTFDYFKTYKDLKNILNTDPKILIYEDLSLNPKYFVNSLLNFLGIKDENLFGSIDFSIKNVGRKDIKTGEYFRKKTINHKPLRGSLNFLSNMVPFKKFFFNLFSRQFKDKVKTISYKFDRIVNRHDRIILSNTDVLKIRNYYSSSNDNLSKILKRDLKDLGY